MLGVIAITSGTLCGGCSDDDSDTSTETDTDTEPEEIDTEWYYECEDYIIDVSLSTAIGTVGIVEWSVDGITPESATIEFGLDESYGTEAPVDLSEPGYRTLLLGMKPSTEYHFRIVVDTTGETVESCDCTLTTGPAPNGLPTHTVTTENASAKEGGFTVTSFFMGCETFILDEDGDCVWWYFGGLNMCSRARMSYDGKYMLVRNVNVGNMDGVDVPDDGRIVRVSMDGLESENMYLDNSHHDFALLPDGTLTFIEYDGVSCDDIIEMDAKDNLTQIFHISDHIVPDTYWGVDGCHSNYINYWPDDDTYTVSVLNTNQIIKFTRAGELVWILGGDENQFTGDVSWERQHGHDMYDGKLLFFNNGGLGPSSTSARLFSLDEDNLTVSEDWSYSPGHSSQTLGDAQHLPGGNELITFSNAGVIHEMDPSGNLVEEIFWSGPGGLGYVMRRPTLYGPPPK